MVLDEDEDLFSLSFSSFLFFSSFFFLVFLFFATEEDIEEETKRKCGWVGRWEASERFSENSGEIGMSNKKKKKAFSLSFANLAY